MRTTSLLTLPLVLLLVACAEEPAGVPGGGDDDGGTSGAGTDGDGADGDGSDDGADGDGSGDGADGDGSDDGSDGGGTGGSAPEEEPEPAVLQDRVVDYGAALRTASLKLLRSLPTLEKVKAVSEAADPKEVYEAEIDAMFEDPRFNQRMVKFFQDTFHQGGNDQLNTAPVFAAQVVAEDRPYTELFTASAGNCPTYDGDANTFTPGECNNNVPQAGVLTNPGSMAQFYSNMAFRRVRWVQEIFVCKPNPAQFSDAPVEVDGKDFTSPYPMDSIGNAPINFRDTSAVVCANCHGNMNHIAPLFANFDADGNFQDSVQVMTPTAPDPTVTDISHWLVPGQVTEWRYGVPAANLQELGSAMAVDPDVMQCAVTRLYNFSMSKEDVVADLATVPFEIVEPFYDDFYDNGFSVKETLKSMFKSGDFVRF